MSKPTGLKESFLLYPLGLELVEDWLALPLGFVDTSKTIIDAALALAQIPVDVRDHDSEAQTVGQLCDMIKTIDETICNVEWDNETLPQLCQLLLLQAIALNSISCLSRDPSSASRSTYLFEILPQLWDRKDTHFPTSLSRWSTRCTTLEKWFALPKISGLSDTEVGPALAAAERWLLRSPWGSVAIPSQTQESSLDLVDEVIALVDRRIDDPSFNDRSLEKQSSTLSDLGYALWGHFLITKNIADIDRSISSLETALGLCDPSNLSDSHRTSAHLSASIHSRFQHTGDPKDLGRAIEIDEELLSRSDFLLKEERLEVLQRHVQHMLNLSVTDRSTIDGSRVLEFIEEGLSLAEGVHHSQWLALQRLALAIFRRLGKLKDATPLSSLEPLLNTEQVEPRSPEHMGKEFQIIIEESFWQKLKLAAQSQDEELASRVWEEMDKWGQWTSEAATNIFISDSDSVVNHTIEVLKEYCLSRPTKTNGATALILILVLALQERYRRSGNPQDIRDALSFREPLGPPGAYGLDLNLYAASLNDINGVENIKTLIDIRQLMKAVPLYQPLPTTAGRSLFSAELLDGMKRDMADILHEMHPTLQVDRGGSHEDFVAGLARGLLALSSDDGDPRDPQIDRLISMQTLTSFVGGYPREGEDLERARSYLWERSNTFADDDQSTNAYMFRHTWAVAFFKLYPTSSGSIDHPQIQLALDYLRNFANAEKCSPYFRLDAVGLWLNEVHGDAVWKENKCHVLPMCDLALSLLQEQAWMASDTRASIKLRYRKTGLRSLLVCRAIQVFVDGGCLVAKVLEVIEATQTLAWEQVVKLRTPLDGLAAIDPDLASRFQRLSNALEMRRGISNISNPSEEHEGHPGENTGGLYQELSSVAKEIKAIPGFENFMDTKRSFSEEDLLRAAMHGPVVILEPVSCTAFIFHVRGTSPLEVHGFSLPVDNGCTTLKRWHSSLKRLTGARGEDNSSFSFDLFSSGGESSRAGVPRGQRWEKVETVLEELWRQVVEPVVDRIMGTSDGEKGKSKQWESNVPRLEDRQRIWWCCLGEFSLLPIHAAGIYSDDTTICVSDFFISSYTPTLGALLDAWNRGFPFNPKVLAAVQPNPRGGLRQLPEVKNELAEIVKVVPPDRLLYLGGTDQPDFEGIHTTVENVINKLPEANVLHLACHGTQDPDDPLSSGFFLANGKKLTIEDLMKCRLPSAHIAILSACHTASNDAEQPDESINLASALMFLGFGNIVASKWPMVDSDGPVIARKVYQALFGPTLGPQLQAALDAVNKLLHSLDDDDDDNSSTPTRDSDLLQTFRLLASLPMYSLASTVDDIVRHLRLVEKVPAGQWATFVHIGV